MRYLMLLVEILVAFCAAAQEPDQLERRQEASERTVEEEPLVQESEWRRRHPLCVNTATADELRGLPGLTELQVQRLLAWRRQLGALLVPEELAAVPGWDPETVRRLRPYLTTEAAAPAQLRQALRAGAHTVLLRAARPLQLPEPYAAGDYAGGPERLLLRYRFRSEHLRGGVSLEKDPGEPLTPDFASAHLYWQGSGLLRTLALGDFTVNMGQGLIQWDAPAFGGAADLASLKRQGPFLQPFLSADEYHFSRGAGVTLEKGAWQLSLYASLRRLSGRIDSSATAPVITSINRSGYHRTASERAGSATLGSHALGGQLQWERGTLRLALNARWLRFSAPLASGGKPYERFEAQGQQLRHTSIEWGLTRGPAHFFGEAALDAKGTVAFVQGLLFSGGALWDAALQYRHFPARYAAFDGNAVGRRTEPQNEEGLYVGIQLHPAQGPHLEAWAEGYRFPWLRYGVDAPTGGFNGGVQVGWRPNRKTEAGIRYRCSTEEETVAAGLPMALPAAVRRRALRLQLAQDWGSWRGSFRAEGLWMDDASGPQRGFAESVLLKLPTWNGVRVSLQAHYYDTDSYAARLYQYTEGAGGGSIGIFYGSGQRYSLIMQYDLTKHVHVSVQGIRTLPISRPGGSPAVDAAVTEIRTQLFWH
ncbi:helix-hairpin-helix domain-containing protein [Flaviaesturariibacter aridisoli]|uniref:Helix-hairpin-helix domain-containing protein n=1 Tax=Flaviaesturariibacter aridisoli TaxID=2545761 RepID=A0A4R4E7V3_9BACT|nr:helix-hairpin-helix domain-containing protein [Flaviaesturariibacter aridisoli]TCZ75023.1 helix-hairpin-helix domain-containing protein [Flaviaesturariibacter aridisoli]